MGRTATISRADVARARAELRSAGLPHGITAIRRQIGRGSPQLIARFVGELDERIENLAEPPLEGRKAMTEERDRQIAQMKDRIAALEARLARAEAAIASLAATTDSQSREIAWIARRPPR